MFFRDELWRVMRLVWYSEGDYMAWARPGERAEHAVFWMCAEVRVRREGDWGAGCAHEVGFYPVAVGP